MGIVRSARAGNAFTIPLNASAVTSSQSGTPRRCTSSSASWMRTTVLTGRIVPPVDRAFVGVAALALQEELQSLASAVPADRPRVSCHSLSSDPSPLGGATAVVRNRGDVLDQVHGEARRLQAAERGLAARARSLHEDLHLPHAELGGL